MATVTAPPARAASRAWSTSTSPKWLERIPVWAITAGVLVVPDGGLRRTCAPATARRRQFWKDEAITTGIASHSLSAIPGVLRHDGSPPLFYLLLHFWMQHLRRRASRPRTRCRSCSGC